MLKYLNKKNKKAQSAIEYLMLLAAVVAIVLIGFKTYLPRILVTGNIYFNRVGVGIMGEPPRCGDKVCRPPPFEDCERCPADCGSCP